MKKNIRNLLILGNSVALVTKPETEDNITYAALLSRDFNVKNGAERASMICDPKNWEINDIEQYDGILLNFGVVEACTRPIPRKLYKFLFNTNPFILLKPIVFILKYLENKFRSKLVLIRGKQSWMTSAMFKDYLQSLINGFRTKNPNAAIFLFEINKPSQRIEEHLPGSKEQIQHFNTIIREVCDKNDLNLVPTSSIIPPSMIPDGIHFNHKGHEKVADYISEVLEKK